MRVFAVAGMTLLGLVALGSVQAQVAAGGGGKPRPEQFFPQAPEFAGRIFQPGVKLTAAERRRRNASWRAEIRRQLYLPAKLPPVAARLHSSFSPMPGVIADRVSYATADGMRVPAIVYRPDPKLLRGKGKIPGLVVVNGHGADKFSWYDYYSGVLFARAGAVVVTFDPLGEGERNRQRASLQSPAEHDRAVDLPHWGQRLAGLMQMDVMQAVSYLRSMPQVDPARIGTVGFSMGSFITGITGAIDPRIHAVLLSGGGSFDGTHEFYDEGSGPCQSPPWRSLAVLGDRAAILYALNADRGPMLLMNGETDKVVHITDYDAEWFAAVRKRAEALHGSEAGLFTAIRYPGVSHRTNWFTLEGVLWLNQQLHFALWDEAAIRAAGTTHISQWIAQTHMQISPNYLREDREGGLDAIGRGFPGVSRDQLMVYPEQEWLASRQELLYDGWAAKASRLESGTGK